jgi:hypothetical protein
LRAFFGAAVSLKLDSSIIVEMEGGGIAFNPFAFDSKFFKKGKNRAIIIGRDVKVIGRHGVFHGHSSYRSASQLFGLPQLPATPQLVRKKEEIITKKMEIPWLLAAPRHPN